MTTTKLSDSALIVLGNAAAREDRMVEQRAKIPAIAQLNVARSLVPKGLLETVALRHGAKATLGLVTMGAEDDGLMGFRITDAGFRAINQEPPAAPVAETARARAPKAAPLASTPEVDQEAAAVAGAPGAATVLPGGRRAALLAAAALVLRTWDDPDEREVDIIGALDGPMAKLRAALAGPAPRQVSGTPRAPREGTKMARVLEMLRRAEGASGPAIQEAMGWNSDTTRGFLAGLKKKGIEVAVLERVRQAGPKGAFTVYHVAAQEAADAA